MHAGRRTDRLYSIITLLYYVVLSHRFVSHKQTIHSPVTYLYSISALRVKWSGREELSSQRPTLRVGRRYPTYYRLDIGGVHLACSC